MSDTFLVDGKILLEWSKDEERFHAELAGANSDIGRVLMQISASYLAKEVAAGRMTSGNMQKFLGATLEMTADMVLKGTELAPEDFATVVSLQMIGNSLTLSDEERATMIDALLGGSPLKSPPDASGKGSEPVKADPFAEIRSSFAGEALKKRKSDTEDAE